MLQRYMQHKVSGMYIVDEEERNEYSINPNELRYLPPSEKKKLIRSVILRLLRKAEHEGITVSEVAAITGLDQRTVSRHLEYLVAIREAYSIERGKYKIYFPNGRIMHPFLNKDFELSTARDTRYYNFSFLENQYGKFIYVQEKSKDTFNRFSISGGILINLECVEEFLEHFEDFVRRVKEWKDQDSK